MSQTTLERQHIAAALVFELSKVETRAIRSRVVAHLLNVDDKLAMNVAEGLRLESLPAAATRVVPPRVDLPASPALSIMRSRPQTFSGRKLGALVTDGVDGGFLRQLETEFNEVGATLELIAPCDRRRQDRGWRLARGQADDRNGAFGAVRRRGPRGRAAGEQGDRQEPVGGHVRRRCVRALQVHRLYGRMRGHCSSGRSQARRSTAAANRSRPRWPRRRSRHCAAQLRFWSREPVLGL